MMNLKDVSMRILNLRKESGLSRAKLSELSGVPIRTLEDWEAGRRLPRDVYQIWAVSHTLGLTIESYIGFEE